MRVFRVVAVILGWLLTPFVAWAASFCGAWLGALVAALIPAPVMGLLFAVVGAATAAFLATGYWIAFLRRSPKVREVLAVTEEGVPVSVAGEVAGEGEGSR